ncbi:DoxX family protein [Streptomyces flavochromogenes]|uniref:DoxX family protein n=1 Tax=Streptomyces flavochromogenes TaxID=68199 RepID=A0ABW6Y0E5_9ACTN
MTSPAIDRTSTAAAPSPHAYAIGLLVLRLAVGLTMAVHGGQKLFGWFGGGGVDGTAQFFTSVGYPSGKAMALVAGLTETLGGLGLALGLLTPLMAAGLLGTLVNALAVKTDAGFSFFAPQGVEYELLLTTAAVVLALTGPGRYAVDRFLPVLRSHRLAHGVLAVALGVVVAAVVLVVRG